MGIIADLRAGAGHYRNKVVNLLSYMLMSLGSVYTYVVFLLIRILGQHDAGKRQWNSPILIQMSASAPSWLLAVIIIGTLAIAVPVVGSCGK